MDARLNTDRHTDGEFFDPVERIDGSRRAGVLVICDHATNAFPPGYGTLGLPPRRSSVTSPTISAPRG